MTKSRGIRAQRIALTERQVEEIRRRYPHEKTEKIARDLGLPVARIYSKAAWMGLSKTPEYMATPDACRLRRDNPNSVAYRYPKGHVPANKGLRRPGYAPGKMAETQFKKGQKPPTWKPIGAERTSKEGYLQVKLKDTGVTRHDYVPVHHLVWELHRGSIPDGHRIAFKDGDKNHIAIENLEAVSVADMMRRNTYHNYPKEVAQLIQLRGAVQRKINRRLKDERANTTNDE